MRLTSLRAASAKLLEEGFGAGMGDGAQIGFQLLLGHADAGIGNGEGVFLSSQIDGDFQGHMGCRRVLFLHQTLVPEFFQGVGGVGDQLADKDITLGVERVDDDIQDLSGLRLKKAVIFPRRRHRQPITPCFFF
jgi:hypothetical protein